MTLPRLKYKHIYFGLTLNLIILLYATIVFGCPTNGDVTLSWTPPTTNADGTPLTELAGYNVYYGTSTGNYSQSIDVGNVTTYQVRNLMDGLTYYFVVTAYDASGNESGDSNEVNKTIQPPVVDAGPDQAVTLPNSAILDGTVIDDGLPSSTLITTWSQVSGPGTVTFANASAVDTFVWFTAAGTYELELTANDGELTNSDLLSVTVNPEGTQVDTIEIRVATGNDDAEESSSGRMYLNSSDLELIREGGNQTVGMRFNGVTIPQGATITNAYIQFQADETHSGATSLTIQGQDIDNAPAFTSSTGNISSRARTEAFVSWEPVPWTRTGEADPDQQTPNIASIIQVIVNQMDWSEGNSLVIIITGTGKRTAESYNGDSSGAPLLHVEYHSP